MRGVCARARVCVCVCVWVSASDQDSLRTAGYFREVWSATCSSSFRRCPLPGPSVSPHTPGGSHRSCTRASLPTRRSEQFRACIAEPRAMLRSTFASLGNDGPSRRIMVSSRVKCGIRYKTRLLNFLYPLRSWLERTKPGRCLLRRRRFVLRCFFALFVQAQGALELIVTQPHLRRACRLAIQRESLERRALALQRQEQELLQSTKPVMPQSRRRILTYEDHVEQLRPMAEHRGRQSFLLRSFEPRRPVLMRRQSTGRTQIGAG